MINITLDTLDCIFPCGEGGSMHENETEQMKWSKGVNNDSEYTHESGHMIIIN